MEWQTLLIDGYDRILEILERALQGMTPKDLGRQPKPDCNSMGWLAWHLTRVQDGHVADLMEEEQLWISGGWHAKLERPPDPSDIGFGDSPEQVAAFMSPSAEVLMDYQRAVVDRTKGYISSLSAADLDRELNEPWYQPLPTVGVRLISILSDSLQHAGQIAYIRGLLKGKGWQGF